MKESHLMDKFLEFEERNKLLDKKIQGVRFWHYIRFNLYFELVRGKQDISKRYSGNREKIDILKIVYFKIKQIPYFIFRNPFIGIKEKDILILNHSRRVKNGDFYDCMYTEFLKDFDFSYCVFEEGYNGSHLSPVKTENLKYLDYINLIVDIKFFFTYYFNFYNLTKKEDIYLKNLIKDINKYFGVNVSSNIGWIK